jgi:hypothetical protein
MATSRGGYRVHLGRRDENPLHRPTARRAFSETNDNSVAILLSNGTASMLLAGDAEAREEEYMAGGPTPGLLPSSTFPNYTHSEPRFHALVTEGASEVKLALVYWLDARSALTELRARKILRTSPCTHSRQFAPGC